MKGIQPCDLEVGQITFIKFSKLTSKMCQIALIHDAKINVLILILAKPVLHLRAMHILFAGLEGPREARLEHYCFKCVAFESDADCYLDFRICF